MTRRTIKEIQAHNRKILDDQRAAGTEAKRAALRGARTRVWQQKLSSILAVLEGASGPLTAEEIRVYLGYKGVGALSLPLAKLAEAGRVRKIYRPQATLWELREARSAEERIEGVVLTWHRRTTAGGTTRLELVTHREGQPIPRWTKAITPDQPREPVVAAALAFWRRAS